MNEEKKAYQKRYREQYKSQVKRVNLTLSKEEHRLFSRASNNKKVTAFIKELALAGLNKQASIPAHLEEELKTLRFAIRNIANNVNQIAHHSNAIQSMTMAEENNLLLHLKQLDEVVQSYTEGRIIKNDYDH